MSIANARVSTSSPKPTSLRSFSQEALGLPEDAPRADSTGSLISLTAADSAAGSTDTLAAGSRTSGVFSGTLPGGLVAGTAALRRHTQSPEVGTAPPRPSPQVHSFRSPPPILQQVLPIHSPLVHAPLGCSPARSLAGWLLARPPSVGILSPRR